MLGPQLLLKTAESQDDPVPRKDGTITVAKLPVDGKEIRRIRGQEISIFQGMSSQSVHTVFNQLAEAMILFQGMTKKQARERCVELLKLVGISTERCVDGIRSNSAEDAPARDDRHGPGEEPRILMADEPATALDDTPGAGAFRRCRTSSSCR